MDKIVVNRTVYSLLDFIGDVGGLHAALFFLFSFVFMMCSANGFDNFLISLLFKAEKPDGSKWNEAFKFATTGQAIDHNRLNCCGQLFLKIKK